MKRPFFFLLLLAGAWDPVSSTNPDVDQGNKAFAGGSFEDAAKRYQAARERLAGEPALHFDLGAALHGQGLGTPPGPQRERLFDAAEKELRLALDTTDPRLRAGAHYNLGNTLFERGKYIEAIDEYKKSLRLDPAREDARHNLELALRRKKEPEPKPQPQPRPDPQQQPQPQSGQEPQPQPQAQGQPDEKPDTKPDGQKPDEQKEPQKGQQPAPDDLTRDDEERKLDELEDASRRLQAGRTRDRAAERRRGKPVKDW